MKPVPIIGVALSGLLILAVAMGIGRFAFTPLLPMMEKDAGVSIALGGWLAAANYVGYLLGAVSAIRLRFPPVRIIIVSLAAVVLFTAGMGYTDQSALWLLLRALAGMASAWVLVFTSARDLHRLAAAQASRLNGVVFGGVGVGIILAGLLCMGFQSLQWSSAASWRALAFVALLLSVFALPALLDRAPDPTPVSKSQSRAAPRGIAALVIAYAIFGFGYIIPATFLPAMARHLVPDPAIFGWAWPVFGLAGLISTLIAGRLSARFSNRAMWGMSHLVMGAGTVLPVLVPGMAGILLAALCVGGTFMVVTATGLQEARRLSPHDPAKLMAKFTVAFAIGQILGPVCVSLAPAGDRSLHLLLAVSAVLLIASGFYLLRIRNAD
ncbi:MAG TPA: YbfB/YjiJ family MFS transporter [Gammaproteobacteria bacterium]|jgi:MFS family permease|nr:YbfB/YjiJ family MFS transporter [Gammaproteobacteria bacterium]